MTMNSRNAPCLVFNDVFAGYFDTVVLRGISAMLEAGQVLGVVGRNGVGKSTLMHTLAGFIAPYSGSVSLHGEPLDGLAPQVRRARGLSYAPQERVVFDDLTVADNLTLGSASRDLSRFDASFARFPRIGARLRQVAGRMSGGEKKLLSFVRVIGERAPLTLIDEPTEGVAQENLDLMVATLQERKRDGAAFVIVEQNLSFLLAVADSILVLDHGECVLDGRLDALSREQIEQHLVV